MIRVTPKTPCPICDHHDWCGLSEDGGLAVCMRVPEGSIRTARNGGFVHRLGCGQNWKHRSCLRYTRPGKPARSDLAQLAAKFTEAIDPNKLASLAEALGLTVESLRRLGIGWNADAGAWAFPMKDANGQIIGFRLRLPDGRKLAVRGGREGLFIPGESTLANPLLICEGPTDTAAGLDLGFSAVGRPSCNTGAEFLVKLSRGYHTVILSDNDPPGRHGAILLAQRLALYCPSVKVVCPVHGVKDLRQWLAKGLTREALNERIETVPAVKLRIEHKSERKSNDKQH